MTPITWRDSTSQTPPLLAFLKSPLADADVSKTLTTNKTRSRTLNESIIFMESTLIPGCKNRLIKQSFKSFYLPLIKHETEITIIVHHMNSIYKKFLNYYLQSKHVRVQNRLPSFRVDSEATPKIAIIDSFLLVSKT